MIALIASSSTSYIGPGCPDVLFEMANDIAAYLDGLSHEEWSTLLDFLPVVLEPLYFKRISRDRNDQRWPRRPRSHRFAFLLGVKDPGAYGRSAFLGYFRTDAGESHARIAEFRQFWGMEAALAGALPWRSALSIVRSTYRRGASNHLIRFLLREDTTL